ncbi:carotenoid oxygenase family protein [Cyanobium sp. CH-040]|nr:carotenoid oxygenase family protein [Cyanobium sp. CH-040]
MLEGSLPPDVHGHAFFMGPGGFLDSEPLGADGLIHPSADGTPLFNGDPLLHRLDFGGDKVRITSRIPKTPCFYTDQACLAYDLWKSFRYANHGLARLSFKLGFRNEVNTAVVPMLFNKAEGNRLIITWDAGRHFEIDPDSLEIATAVGFNSEWREWIPLPLPFGIVTTLAHPAHDPQLEQKATATGERDPRLFSLNYGKSIGTALHPILNHQVDAPFTRNDAKLQADLEQLITVAERLLGAARRLLRLIQWLEKRVHPRLGHSFRGGLRGLLRRRRTDHGPAGSTRTVGKRHVTSELLALLEEQLEEGAKSTTDHVEELLRLLKVARGLLADADSMEDFVDLISWDGQNKLQKWAVRVEGVNKEDGSVSADGSPRILQSMHQMGVTEKYVILMDTAFKLGVEQLLTAPSPKFPKVERVLRNLLDYRQSDYTVLYIISRCDLRSDQEEVTARRVKIPRGTAHFLVDYDNPDDRITLHCAHNTGWDAAEWNRPFDDFPHSIYPGVVGMATGSTDINVLGRYVLNGESGKLLDKQLAEDSGRDLTWMLALCAWCQPDGVTPPGQIKQIFWNGWGSHGDLLPAYIERLNAPAGPRTLTLEEANDVLRRGLPATLLRLDTASMTIADRYVFPAGRFGNSVQFLPSERSTPGGGEGYLLCVVNGSDDPTQSEFWLFNAARLWVGPVCRLGHPGLKVGMTIHSTWVPSIAKRTATYNVPVKTDYDQRFVDIKRMKQNPEIRDLQDFFEEHVYPHFPASDASPTAHQQTSV